MTAKTRLNQADLEHFHDHGFVVLRNAISDPECERLRTALLNRLHTHGHTVSVPRDRTFPEPAKYTLAASDWDEADLAFIVEHPVVLDAVEAVLGKPPLLTAYVAYVRPPNDNGSKAHCDHKRWRPVGSSLNWCFAIVPLVDFDPDVGSLSVCPGSHKLIQQRRQESEKVLSVTPPNRSRLGPFVDPELKCGDLLLLHGNTWHEAPPNQSDRLRIGIFNKYAANNAPPAAGYFKWSDEVYESLGTRGKQTLAVHSNRPLHATRLVLDRVSEGEVQVLLCGSRDKGWTLPGGWVGEDRNRALEAGLDGAWDVGNLIGALGELCREQTGIGLPWMSYVGDYQEENYLCRVYGGTLHRDSQNPMLPTGACWFSVADLAQVNSSCTYLQVAIDLWLDDHTGILRGKGKSEQQCLPVDGPNQYLD